MIELFKNMRPRGKIMLQQYGKHFIVAVWLALVLVFWICSVRYLDSTNEITTQQQLHPLPSNYSSNYRTTNKYDDDNNTNLELLLHKEDLQLPLNSSPFSQITDPIALEEVRKHDSLMLRGFTFMNNLLKFPTLLSGQASSSSAVAPPVCMVILVSHHHSHLPYINVLLMSLLQGQELQELQNFMSIHIIIVDQNHTEYFLHHLYKIAESLPFITLHHHQQQVVSSNLENAKRTMITSGLERCLEDTMSPSPFCLLVQDTAVLRKNFISKLNRTVLGPWSRNDVKASYISLLVRSKNIQSTLISRKKALDTTATLFRHSSIELLLSCLRKRRRNGELLSLSEAFDRFIVKSDGAPRLRSPKSLANNIGFYGNNALLQQITTDTKFPQDDITGAANSTVGRQLQDRFLVNGMAYVDSMNYTEWSSYYNSTKSRLISITIKVSTNHEHSILYVKSLLASLMQDQLSSRLVTKLCRIQLLLSGNATSSSFQHLTKRFPFISVLQNGNALSSCTELPYCLVLEQFVVLSHGFLHRLMTTVVKAWDTGLLNNNPAATAVILNAIEPTKKRLWYSQDHVASYKLRPITDEGDNIVVTIAQLYSRESAAAAALSQQKTALYVIDPPLVNDIGW